MDLLFAGTRLLKFIAVPAHSRDFGWCDFVSPVEVGLGTASRTGYLLPMRNRYENVRR